MCDTSWLVYTECISHILLSALSFFTVSYLIKHKQAVENTLLTFHVPVSVSPLCYSDPLWKISPCLFSAHLLVVYVLFPGNPSQRKTQPSVAVHKSADICLFMFKTGTLLCNNPSIHLLSFSHPTTPNIRLFVLTYFIISLGCIACLSPHLDIYIFLFQSGVLHLSSRV